MKFIAFAALGCALAGPAAAEVVDVQPNGFRSRTVVEIAAPREKVWATLLQVGRWWEPSHSWSGEAKNITIDTRVGGCMCEALPAGGHARHADVIFVEPEQNLRLYGPLGPLGMEGVASSLWFQLEDIDGGTRLTATNTVGGYLTGGAARWAPIVDGVVSTQVHRLERLVETGSPGA